MSYLATDQSAQSGRPVYLYDFAQGATVTRFTNAAESITYGGNAYTPSPVLHGEVNQSGEMNKDSLSLSFPSSDPFALAFLTFAPDVITSLTITRLHTTDGDTEGIVYWKGRVSHAKASGQTISVECESVFTSLRRYGLRARYQKQCRHALYNLGCNLDKEDFAVFGTCTAVSGLVVTVTEAGTFDDGHFTGGICKASDNTMRLIVKHIGTALTLMSPNVAVTASSSVTLYPGCDRQLATCETKFDNLANFGGFPWIPSKNPFSASGV